MKSTMTAVAVAAALGLAGGFAGEAQAADTNALKAEAVGVVKSFGGPLKKALGGAMKEGGPVNAISVCNEKAPAIATKAMTDSGWSVGRTSLKLRNPSNAPDAWELNVLNLFERQKAEGQSPATLAFGEVVETNGKKQFRFMKAIGTEAVCLHCHGKDIQPEVTAALDDLYPDDQARGFSEGDIRGAFTLIKDF